MPAEKHVMGAIFLGKSTFFTEQNPNINHPLTKQGVVKGTSTSINVSTSTVYIGGVLALEHTGRRHRHQNFAPCAANSHFRSSATCTSKPINQSPPTPTKRVPADTSSLDATLPPPAFGSAALLRLAGPFVQRADLHGIPGLPPALAAYADSGTSAPGDGEPEA
jgi:hypothetical protein